MATAASRSLVSKLLFRGTTPSARSTIRISTVSSHTKLSTASLVVSNNHTYSPSVSIYRYYSPSSTHYKKAWDPQEYKYWNREESKHGEASFTLDMSPESCQKEARIVALAKDDDH